MTLDGDGRLDAGMGVVPQDLEILKPVVEEGIRFALDRQLRQGPWLAGKLQRGLLHVVGVEVHITTSPDEVTHLQIALLGHHVGQQGVAGDVERQAVALYATQKRTKHH